MIFLYSQAVSAGPQETLETKIRTDLYGHVDPSHLYDSPIDGPTSKSLPFHENGFLSREHVVEGQASRMEVYSQPGRLMHSSSPRDTDHVAQNDDNVYMERKRKVVLEKNGLCIIRSFNTTIDAIIC